MNQPKSSAEVSETFSEADIADYLRSHPDFFERHAALLLGLRLPHPTGASAVSLVERQVAMLRQRSGALERQLKDLVAVAKANNALVEKIHRLAIELMAQSDFTARLDVLEASLREHFAAERAALVLFGDKTTRDEANPGFVQIIKRDDPALKPFSAFLRAARPRCGQIRDRQRQFVFGREADSIAAEANQPSWAFS